MPIAPLKKKAKPVKGLCSAVVTGLVDDAGEYRVKIKIPGIGDTGENLFARLATLDAGKSRGSFFMPEIDDEVIVAFINDDARQPVILGSLFSSKNPAPLNPEDSNDAKGYVSLSNIKILIDDDKKTVSIETPGGNFFSMSDEKNKVELNDERGNRIIMDSNGITITSATAITLRAGTALDIVAQKLSGKINSALNLQSGGLASISSSGTMEIKGSVVNIN